MEQQRNDEGQRYYFQSEGVPVEFSHSRPITEFEVFSLRAVAGGKADSRQQQTALAVIVKVLSGAYDLEFIPDNPGGSAFRGGRAFVGKEIIKLMNVDIDKLFGGQNEEHT